MTTAYLIMGVSGCGKSTVGQALADALACPFYDGDDFHPPENVAKMASGTPLNDDDRYPWLAALHDLLLDHAENGETAVLASSALKKPSIQGHFTVKRQDFTPDLASRLRTLYTQ